MNTRAKILDAAVRLIAERGYTATTTRAIAEEAGVNEVTIFRHFATKQGVLTAIGEQLSQAERPYGIDVNTADVRGALHAAARIEVEQVTRYGAFAARVAADAPHSPDLAEAFASPLGPLANLSHLARVFEQWQRASRIRSDVEPRLLAEGFAALTGSLLITRHMLGRDLGPTPAADVERLVDLFCDAIEEQS